MKIFLKTIQLISVGLLSIIGIGLMLLTIVIQSGVVQQTVKQTIQSTLESALNRPVSIDKLSGSLVTHIQLTDFEISDANTSPPQPIIKVKTMSLNYSLFHFLRYRFNSMYLIKSITVSDIDIDVIRHENDTWNILEIIKSIENTETNERINIADIFRGKVIVNNVNGRYIDRRGWAPSSLIKTPFIDVFSNVNGILDFRSGLIETPFTVSGRLAFIKDPFRLQGQINLSTFEYEMSVQASKMDMKKWGNYTFDQPGYAFYDGHGSISGKMWSKKPFIKGTIPFEYQFDILATDTTMKLPFFPATAYQTQASLRLTNGAIEFRTFRGIVNKMTWQGFGHINYEKNIIDLQLQSKPFHLPALSGLFPVLAHWNFSGTGYSTLAITGELKSPLITGTLDSDSTLFYGFPTQKNHLELTFKNNILDLSLAKSTLYKGQLTGNVKINFNPTTPYLSATIASRAIHLNTIFPTFSNLSGTANIDLAMNGPIDAYQLDIQLTSPHGTLYNQAITALHVTATVNEYSSVNNITAHWPINNSQPPITITGHIPQFKTAYLSIADTKFPIQFDNKARGSTRINGSLTAHINAMFWQAPLTQLEWDLDTHLTAVTLPSLGPTNGQIKSTASFSTITIKKAELNTDHGIVTATGQLVDGLPHHLQLNTSGLQIESIPQLHALVPPILMPLTGKLSGQFSITQTPKTTHITANAQLKSGLIKGQPITQAYATFTYNPHQLNLNSFKAHLPKSIIVANGTITNDQLDITIQKPTQVDLYELRPLLSQYGNFLGTLFIDGHINGPYTNLSWTTNFKGKNCVANQLAIQSIQGSIGRTPSHIHINALAIENENLSYSLSGSVNPNNPSNDIDLVATINRTDTQALLRHIQYAKQTAQSILLAYQTNLPLVQSPITVPTFKIKSIQNPFLSANQGTLFRQGSHKSSIGFLTTIQRSIEPIHTKEQLWAPWLSGDLTGVLAFKRTPHIPIQLSGDIIIKHGSIGPLSAEFIKASLQQNKRNETIMDLHASSGSIHEWLFKDIYQSGILSTTGDLYLGQNTLIHESGTIYTDSLSGQFPISGLLTQTDAPLNLSIQLKNDTIGLLPLIIPPIKSITGSGNIQLLIDGTLTQPTLKSGAAFVTDIQFERHNQSTKQRYYSNQAIIRLRDNQIEFDPISISWSGESTETLMGKEFDNTVTIHGGLHFKSTSLLHPDALYLDIDITVNPTKLTINIPALYRGNIALNQTSIKGTYIIGLSPAVQASLNQQKRTSMETGPVIAGHVTLSEGKIILPKLGTKSQLPSMLLDISLEIDSGLSVEGGLLGASLLADLANQLRVDLKPTQQDLVITGSFNTPRIQNSIEISNGEGYLINRIFDIMKPNQQRQFYPNETTILTPNTVSFETRSIDGSSTLSLIPILNLKALTVIETDLTTPNATLPIAVTNTVPAKAMVLALDGPLDDVSSIRFDEFELDRTQVRSANPIFVKSYRLNASAQDDTSAVKDAETVELLEALLPEFSTNPDPGAGSSQSVINKISENRLNLFFKSQVFRPIERELTKQVGLYDIQVDYNAGGALLDGIGAQEAQLNNQIVGINFIEDISSNLFFRLRTDLDFTNRQNRNSFQVSEIELTYYLMRNLSANYANIRQTNQLDASFEPRFSIKYSYEY